MVTVCINGLFLRLTRITRECIPVGGALVYPLSDAVEAWLNANIAHGWSYDPRVEGIIISPEIVFASEEDAMLFRINYGLT